MNKKVRIKTEDMFNTSQIKFYMAQNNFYINDVYGEILDEIILQVGETIERCDYFGYSHSCPYDIISEPTKVFKVRLLHPLFNKMELLLYPYYIENIS